jgi:hypothetical protein
MISYFDQLENESKALKEEVLKLCWFMRGSLSYDEGMMLSYSDRNSISKLVKENLETAKKSGMPFF